VKDVRRWLIGDGNIQDSRFVWSVIGQYETRKGRNDKEED